MILIKFKIKNIDQITQLITNEITTNQINNIHNIFNIPLNHMGFELGSNNTFSILIDRPDQVINILIYIINFLNDNNLKATIFITTGLCLYPHYEHIGLMIGTVFYRYAYLEQKSKPSKIDNFEIHYNGGSNTDLLNLTFLSFSKLTLNKPKYLKTLYMYKNLGYNQAKIAKELGISQSTVSNQLSRINSDMLNSYENTIIKLLKDDLDQL